METEYYILDENKKAKQVSQQEYIVWKKKNEKKINLSWQRGDGTKIIALIFNGTKKTKEKLVLFSVRSIYCSCMDYEILSDFSTDFETYKDALENYNLEVSLNDY